MARVTFSLLARGHNPGSNVCIVVMEAAGKIRAVVSESDQRTIPQAEVDGLLKALGTLKEPCDVELRTHSQCLIKRLKALDTFPHAVAGVYVPKERPHG